MESSFPNLPISRFKIAHGDSAKDMPLWAKTFINFGKLINTANNDHQSSRPKLIGLCIPRVDYAAIFIGFGAFLSKTLSYEESRSEAVKRLDSLIGGQVVYESRGQPHPGLLEAIDHDKQIALVVVQKAKGIDHHFEVQYENWHKIRASSISVDIEMGVGKRLLNQAQQHQKNNESIAQIFSPAVAEGLAQETQPFATAFVEKSRVQDELDELEIQTNRGSISIEEVLNLKQIRTGTKMKLKTASSDVAIAPSEINIIEAGRSLAEQLQQLENRPTVVLLGRNRASYKEAAAAFSMHVSHSSSVVSSETPFEIPAYMRSIILK